MSFLLSRGPSLCSYKPSSPFAKHANSHHIVFLAWPSNNIHNNKSIHNPSCILGVRTLANFRRSRSASNVTQKDGGGRGPKGMRKGGQKRKHDVPYTIFQAHEELHKFRLAIADSDLKAVVALYPTLSNARLLKPQDTCEILRLLHYAFRSKSTVMPPTELDRHVRDCVERIKRRQLPPHTRANLHIISYFRDSKLLDDGVGFWNWTVAQDDNYVSLETCGAAIELLAAQGHGLSHCEEVYAYALKRFPSNFNEYHMSHGAILSQRDQYATIPKTSMTLLQGIISARLTYGDWRNAYLGLDTALRLHPTQVPPHIFRLFLNERPIHEAYQVLCLICQGGNLMRPEDLTVFLAELLNRQTEGSGDAFNLGIAMAILNALHICVGSGQAVNAAHMNILLQSCLKLLPRAKSFPDSSDESLSTIAMDIFRRALSIPTLLGIAPLVSSYNILIAAAGELSSQFMFNRAIEALKSSLCKPDAITFSALLIAAARINGAGAVETVWNSRDPSMPLTVSTWVALAKATAITENRAFLDQQVTAHGIANDSAVMYKIRASITKASNQDKALKRTFADANESLAKCLSNVEKFSTSIDAFTSLLKTTDHKNLKRNPPTSRSIWPSGDLVKEEWQAKLYDELTLDSAAVSLVGGLVTPEDENGAQESRRPKPIECPTGFPLDELRYRNWKGINDLLLYAELFEARFEEIVNKAIAEGKPARQSRAMYAAPSYRQHEVLKVQLMEHLRDVNQLKSSEMTGSEWGERILHLRRPKAE